MNYIKRTSKWGLVLEWFQFIFSESSADGISCIKTIFYIPEVQYIKIVQYWVQRLTDDFYHLLNISPWNQNWDYTSILYEKHVIYSTVIKISSTGSRDIGPLRKLALKAEIRRLMGSQQEAAGNKMWWKTIRRDTEINTNCVFLVKGV